VTVKIALSTEPELRERLRGLGLSGVFNFCYAASLFRWEETATARELTFVHYADWRFRLLRPPRRCRANEQFPPNSFRRSPNMVGNQHLARALVEAIA
jgi:hypothetical protein